MEGYTATDILARYKRAKGFNVLHPMGWDSFGFPAEQYAIRTGTHPAISTEQNIDNFRRQLRSLDLAMIGTANLPQAIHLIINGRSGFLQNSMRKDWLMKPTCWSTFALLWELFWPMKKWKNGVQRRADIPLNETSITSVDAKNHRLCRPFDRRFRSCRLARKFEKTANQLDWQK